MDLRIRASEEEVIPVQFQQCEAHFKSDKPHSEGRVGSQLHFTHVFNTNKTQDWSQTWERDIHQCCDLIKQTFSSLRQTVESTLVDKRRRIIQSQHTGKYY